MANLDKKDLGKRSNDEVFLEKFFEKNNRANLFNVKRKSGVPKEGILEPSALVFMVDGDEVVSYEKDQGKNFDEALSRIQENMNLTGPRNKILLVGKFKNDGSISTVSLSDLEKTSEFGGQQGGNQGNKFEDEFLRSIESVIQCNSEKTKYKKQAHELIKLIDKNHKVKGSISKAVKVGGANKPRPLSYSGGLYVTAGGKKTKNIGSTVSDITATFGGAKEIYLSCKFGDTLTFINSGVKNVFKDKDYKGSFKGYKNNIGDALFEMFAIDKIEYAKIFNDYGKGYKGKPVNVTQKCQKNKIEDLLQYAIGYNYYMVHQSGPKFTVFEMTEQLMKKSSKLTGQVILHYGGQRGNGKRLDITCESSEYKFMFNLRNKQGGLYPSHIMCDYKKK